MSRENSVDPDIKAGLIRSQLVESKKNQFVKLSTNLLGFLSFVFLSWGGRWLLF